MIHNQGSAEGGHSATKWTVGRERSATGSEPVAPAQGMKRCRQLRLSEVFAMLAGSAFFLAQRQPHAQIAWGRGCVGEGSWGDELTGGAWKRTRS